MRRLIKSKDRSLNVNLKDIKEEVESVFFPVPGIYSEPFSITFTEKFYNKEDYILKQLLQSNKKSL